MKADKISCTHNKKTYTYHLIRESRREHGKVKNRTLANISHLPLKTIEHIKRSLAGVALVPKGQLFKITKSKHHGHVAAVYGMLKKLKLDSIIDPEASRQRSLSVL